MTEAKTKPYAPRVVSEGDIPVHKTTGEVAQTRNVGIPRPMPGIVILVHGVNDVGEAYQNGEKVYLPGWVSDLTGRIFTPTNGKTTELSPVAFPIIPFYWGYKPVTHADYRADQKRYREEVGKLSDKAHLPYDAYQKITRRIKSRWVMTEKGRFSTRTITLKRTRYEFCQGAGPLPTRRRRSRICWGPAPVASAFPLRDLPRCTSMMAILPILFMKTHTAFTSFCRSTAGGFDFNYPPKSGHSK